MPNNRRDFIKKSALAGAGVLGMNLSGQDVFGQSDKIHERSADGMVKAGFIGVGSRGRSHLNDTMALKDVEIVAVCDIQKSSLDEALKMIAGKGRKAPRIYTGNEKSFEDMLKNEALDAVIIATPWEWHVPMSVASMKAGIPYTAVEVSAANTLEECWDLVNVHEETGKELMILENVCYRRDVMAVLNMVRTGLMGEIIHCRCGYEHDLRSVKFNDGVHYDYIPGGALKWARKPILRHNGERCMPSGATVTSIQPMGSDL
jgi:predicted dehydrogenase